MAPRISPCSGVASSPLRIASVSRQPAFAKSSCPARALAKSSAGSTRTSACVSANWREVSRYHRGSKPHSCHRWWEPWCCREPGVRVCRASARLRGAPHAVRCPPCRVRTPQRERSRRRSCRDPGLANPDNRANAGHSPRRLRSASRRRSGRERGPRVPLRTRIRRLRRSPPARPAAGSNRYAAQPPVPTCSQHSLHTLKSTPTETSHISPVTALRASDLTLQTLAASFQVGRCSQADNGFLPSLISPPRRALTSKRSLVGVSALESAARAPSRTRAGHHIHALQLALSPSPPVDLKAAWPSPARSKKSRRLRGILEFSNCARGRLGRTPRGPGVILCRVLRGDCFSAVSRASNNHAHQLIHE